MSDTKHYCDFWKCGDDIVIIIDDKTAVDRTNEQLDKMMEEMREVCNRYEFDFNLWGSRKSMHKHLVKWNEIVIESKQFEEKASNA